MATLLLSTIGSALGGPVGGAIGALIGQSFDQQLLAPATRGPRLGDLSVQTSTYGTQIPRIYGSMRVAGSVVWATDLVQSEQISGAKGQPDLIYSYSVSLAVALSSRPIAGIGRIWADGKLLRSAAGEFTVPVSFRFYTGSESQSIDPLIGSAEGIANAPAYRGIAMAVFEDLELAEFGNRIPFLTFEVIADDGPSPVADILADASGRRIHIDNLEEAVVGYAAYGRSISSAVRPLVEAFDIPLFDDGSVLRAPAAAAPVLIAADELGSSSDGEKVATVEREHLSARAAPSTLRLRFYDPERDYQSGEARALAAEQNGNEAEQELPAVLSADDAKRLAEGLLNRTWQDRHRLKLRLPPGRLPLEPGSVIETSGAPGRWVIDKCMIEGFVSVIGLRPHLLRATMPAAVIRPFARTADVTETAPVSLALFEAPSISDGAAGTVYVAASSPTPDWRPRAITISGAGQRFVARTARRKSIMGTATTVLPAAEAELIDEVSSVDVKLVDMEQWLTSCDGEARAAGANLAVIGQEFVQFGEATALGGGRFRLRRLLRGRGGSEWAAGTHAAGELFCLIDRTTISEVSFPAWLRAAEMGAREPDGAAATLQFGAEACRPPAPVQLSAEVTAEGALSLRWARRSRRGLAWLDEVDVPLGEECEQYRVTLTADGDPLEFIADAPSLVIGRTGLASLHGRTVRAEVRQIGDYAASRPAQLTFQLP